ncbi:hypothetical protein [Streptomyces sp. HNM0574]|nr:hypothetical protein [Streptomyces sp. HNM0574]
MLRALADVLRAAGAAVSGAASLPFKLLSRLLRGASRRTGGR